MRRRVPRRPSPGNCDVHGAGRTGGPLDYFSADYSGGLLAVDEWRGDPPTGAGEPGINGRIGAFPASISRETVTAMGSSESIPRARVFWAEGPVVFQVYYLGPTTQAIRIAESLVAR